MMKRIFGIVICAAAICAACAAPALCKAQSSMARTDFFLEGSSARAFGVGGAFASIADDSGAAYWNPAGLLLLREGQFHTTHSAKDEIGLTTQALSLAMPAFRGMAAMNFVYTSSDDFLITTENATTGRLEPAGTMSEADTGASFSYAWPAGRYLFAGATIKNARQKIGGGNAEGWGADVGAIYLYDYATRFSLALQNVGDMQIGTDEAPMNARLGVSRRFDRDRLIVAASYDFNYFEEEVLSVGGEYAVEETFFARMGTTGSRFSAGVGFNYENFNVDYAFMNDKNSGDEQKLSITYMINSSRKRMPKRLFRARQNTQAVSSEPVVLKPKRKEKPEEQQKPAAREESAEETGGLKLKENSKPEKETAPAKTEEKETSEKPAEKKGDKSSSAKSKRKSKTETKSSDDKEKKNSEKSSPSIEWEKPAEAKKETPAKKEAPSKKEAPAEKIKNAKTIPASVSGINDPYGEAPATGAYIDPLSMPFNEYGAMSGVAVEELPMALPEENASEALKLDVPVDLNKNWWPEPQEENEGQFGLDAE